MTEGIIKEATGLAKLINDPVLIVLTIVIVALLVFIYYMARQAEKKEQRHFETTHALTEEIHNNSQTLIKLTTLVEVLVHGRNVSSN